MPLFATLSLAHPVSSHPTLVTLVTLLTPPPSAQVHLHEVVDTPKQIYLIMEFCNGGELFDYIVAHQRVCYLCVTCVNSAAMLAHAILIRPPPTVMCLRSHTCDLLRWRLHLRVAASLILCLTASSLCFALPLSTSLYLS